MGLIGVGRNKEREPFSLGCRRRRGWASLATATLALLNATPAIGAALAQPAAVIVGAPEVQVDGVAPGEVLLGELNCVACHAAEPPVKDRLKPKQPPLLGEAGARLLPGYLRAYLAGPLAEKPGVSMPDLLHDLPAAARSETIEALAHFLGSPARPAGTPLPTANRLVTLQGRVLYHQVGCVACHAPQEPANDVFPNPSGGGGFDAETSRFLLNKLSRDSAPLGSLARKYSPGQLARFLADPIQVRPSGRMPALNLSQSEATAIAAYLQRDQAEGPFMPSAVPLPAVSAGASPPRPQENLSLSRQQAARGKKLFAALGCAACHQLRATGPELTSALKAKPLASLDAAAQAGCLGAHPAKGVPQFHLSEEQRQAMRATLAGREQLSQPLAAKLRVAYALVRLNCFTCHSREGVGGPIPSRSDYFSFVSEADLGDEGRISPHLTEVGNKLRPEWMREVMLNKGVARPYMATRMPQYGAANAELLLTDFEKADTPWPALPAVASAPDDAQTGRLLVGVGGCSCVSCHRFGQYKSLSLSVMDMTVMARRLKPDWFRRYLPDPAGLRPGTRMPSFWPEGKAAIQNVLGGDTGRQIAAIWAFLSKGDAAETPPGLGQ
jgi:mono/diheme cytochrome c family protein